MLSEVFRALGDPTRRRILRMLAERDRSAGEIASVFDISKPSISHHLATLKQAGLVRDERRGQQIIYSLNTTVFDDVVGWIFELTGRSSAGAVAPARGGAPCVRRGNPAPEEGDRDGRG